MKKSNLYILFALILAVFILGFSPKKPIDPKKEKKLHEIILRLLQTEHYNPVAINNDFSKAVFKNYIESLDPNKFFLIDSDIAEFEEYETQLDDLIKANDLTFFYFTFDRIMMRMREGREIYLNIFKNPIDFRVEEEGIPNLKSHQKQKKLSEIWRLAVKQEVLEELVKRLEIEEAKKHEDPTFEMLSLNELEQAAREYIKTKFERTTNNYTLLNREYFFQQYINAIAAQFDPHTSYLKPFSKDNFDENLSGKLEGVGLVFANTYGFLEINKIIVGGPAWKTKKLNDHDIILKVAQEDGSPVDVVGFSAFDLSKLTRGPKGTIVKLTIKKQDGSIKVVAIKRGVVEIDDSYAKSSIVEKNGRKVGVITLPKFYKDFDDNNNRDAAKDMARELELLKRSNVEGIVIDLRENGGGAMETVIDIARMFIDKGPVVQLKAPQKDINILSITESKMQWDGPLVIVTNKDTASSSEIFTATMQDYKRAIIMGGSQTYGKGTVQEVINLNQYNHDKETTLDYGALKLTVQKYYRINGEATQLNGIASDIIMPDSYTYQEYGERYLPHVLPNDKIKALTYVPYQPKYDTEKIIKASQARIQKNRIFQLIDERGKYQREKLKDNETDLQLTSNRAKKSKQEREEEAFYPIEEYTNGLSFLLTPAEQVLVKKDEGLALKRKTWFSRLARDIYIEEAVNVLIDMTNIQTQKVAFKTAK
jgi:carboxyl-terminal processing protease